MSIFAKLPRMTDPKGRYWPQPANLRDRVRVYESHATILEADWEALPRYEASMPSGTYTGKVWRRDEWLMWYGRQHAGTITIACARAEVVKSEDQL